MTEVRLICTVAIELSRSRWVIGALPPRERRSPSVPFLAVTPSG